MLGPELRYFAGGHDEKKDCWRVGGTKENRLKRSVGSTGSLCQLACDEGQKRE